MRRRNRGNYEPRGTTDADLRADLKELYQGSWGDWKIYEKKKPKLKGEVMKKKNNKKKNILKH